MLLLTIIDRLFLVYFIMLFIRILSSWVPEYADSRFVRFIAFCTDPYLNFFRRIIPPLGMIDFSPIIAFIALQIIESTVKWAVASLL